jgi:hypothetical protein
VRTIHSTMSPGKLARLIELEANPRAPRVRGLAGCYCMRLGWVEWLHEIDGVEITQSEFDSKYPTEKRQELWSRDAFKTVGEVLTDAGRAALAEARKK